MTGISLTEDDKAILLLLYKQPELTQKKIALELDWTVDRVKYYLNKMKKKHIIKRVGSSHNGHWELLIEEAYLSLFLTDMESGKM